METPPERLKKALRDVGFTQDEYVESPGTPPSVHLTPGGYRKALQQEKLLQEAGLHLYHGGRGIPASIAFSQDTMKKWREPAKRKKRK